MRVAVITPYAQESSGMLAQCCASVRAQTHPCTHILVADGSPSAEVARWTQEHIVLPCAHRDYGNTPRGIGSIAAWNRGFDAVAYLDADNWYDPGHIASLVELCRGGRLLAAFSDRHVVLEDGSLLGVPDPTDASREHVDTSCMFFTAAAAFVTTVWAMMDPPLAPIGDRIIFSMVRLRGLAHGWTGRKTVYFRSRYAYHHALAGRPAPADPHEPDEAAILRDYSPRRCAERLGFAFDLTRPAPADGAIPGRPGEAPAPAGR